MGNKVADLGKVVGTVEVQIGPQLLEVFSEQLYSSPNKAFEELVSNSWDAGANAVYIGFPEEAASGTGSIASDTQKESVIWVLDDGASMDHDGLRELWTIAFSVKREKTPEKGRHPIGKFGVGKLATYLLANNITYFCKAADGQIRSVEVDYSSLIADSPNKLTSNEPKKLEVRCLDMSQLEETLQRYTEGVHLYDLIKKGVPQPKAPGDQDEYGGDTLPDAVPSSTWTLALLTSLKAPGKALQAGRIRYMLRASLPLSQVMTITLNEELLESTKADEEIDQEWKIGPDLGIAGIAVPAKTGNDLVYNVLTGTNPAYLEIEGVPGHITGQVRLYKDRISGGKSELEGASNGFFVNVLGRVINLGDNHFGLTNLSHGAWAKFRATVRADWLDAHLSVNRESVTETPQVAAFRALLLALFNKVRGVHDASENVEWPKAGDILTKRYGAFPLKALCDVISEELSSVSTPAPYLFLAPGSDRDEVAASWHAAVDDDPSQCLNDIVLQDMGQNEPLVAYDPTERKVLVNEEHPFSREHRGSVEQKTLLRDTAFADLMTYTYMSDIGIKEEHVRDTMKYRENILRLLAKVRRRTSAQLADLLVKATDHEKGLERALDEAFDHLGFVVKPLAGSGEPEGVAIAPLTPAPDHTPRAYRFTYDAKSTSHSKAKTSNLNIAGLKRHRDTYKADYAIVVAVDFQQGACVDECASNGITPMRAKDLARLLVDVATRGPVDLERFKMVFERCDPDKVEKWVDEYIASSSLSPSFTLDLFLKALASLEFDGPDAVTPEEIAKSVRKLTGDSQKPAARDITRLVHGLETLVPWIVRSEDDNHIVLSGTPSALRAAIVEQLNALPPEVRIVLPTEST